jgi:hypothetical protein
MTIRVVQWTTGGVAKAAVRAVLAHPELELVGCHVWSATKAGLDVGELVGLPPLGITATSDVAEIVELRPDVVVYVPLVWNVDDLVQLLEAGVNVVSTANFITGHSYGEADRLRLDEAARKGGVSLYGSGINPGLASAVALTAAAACREIERISIFEQSDATSYESAQTWQSLGFGLPPDTPRLLDIARQRQLVFQDVVEVMAETLRVTLDEVRYDAQFGLATKDLHLGYMDIPAGTICGLNGKWQGIVGGVPLIEVGLLWRLGQSMEPDWEINEGYQIEVRGVPNVRLRYELDYPTDIHDKDANTANPAVNAIPAVVAARPGIVTMKDLPLITAGSVKS